MDITTVYILMGVAGGLGAGIIIGFFLGYFRIYRSPAIYPLLRSNIVGVAYDVDQNTIDLVPLEHVARGVYFSMDYRNPMIVMKPEDVSVVPMNRIGKSALLIVCKKPHGLGVNPETLAKVGILTISLSREEKLREKLAQRELSHKAYIEIITELLKMEKQYIGEIRVNPDLKLAISFSLPEVAKSMLSILASLSLASIEALKDNLLSARAFLEYMKYRVAGARTEWGKYIMWLIIAGIGAALAMYIIRVFGG